ncbi:transcription initiation factor IIB [Haloarcula rubra]|uniref:transcription initiation factor IIB n=1 Tax=Haloarcula rubra TaxID=2487747 RepID=UPI0022A79CAD|nr:transcription initiation factor IIB family protein [Halomicroarcula rubra]
MSTESSPATGRRHQKQGRSNLSTEETPTSRLASERCCPECESDDLVVQQNETYCEGCGLVVHRDDLDRRRRWNYTESGREPERTGSPTTHRLHDRGLSTDIGYYQDGAGNPLDSNTQRLFSRLRRWDAQSKVPSKRDKSLRDGLSEIARLISVLDLSDSVFDEAVDIYRNAWDANLLKGRSIEAIASGSVFAACRLEQLPRHRSEVADVARVDSDAINNAYTQMNRELELAIPPPLPQDFLPRIASAIGAGNYIEQRARELLLCPAVGRLSNGRPPSGVAAAALYHAQQAETGEKRASQKAIAEAGFTSTLTIRTIWRKLQELEEEGKLCENADTIPTLHTDSNPVKQ